MRAFSAFLRKLAFLTSPLPPVLFRLGDHYHCPDREAQGTREQDKGTTEEEAKGQNRGKHTPKWSISGAISHVSSPSLSRPPVKSEIKNPERTYD